jgi:hypothetical protein
VAFCGIGRIVGYGEAEMTLFATSVLPTSVAGCGFALAVTGVATIELPEGSTLTLEEAGTYCLPGESHFAPGNFFVSYGNPLEIEASYMIVGGIGRLGRRRRNWEDGHSSSGRHSHGRLLWNADAQLEM